MILHEQKGMRSHAIEPSQSREHLFPYGIAISDTSLLIHRSGGGRAFNPLYARMYLSPFFRAVEESGAVVRSSTITDLVDYANTYDRSKNWMKGPLLRNVIPFTFARDIEEISRKALKRRTEGKPVGNDYEDVQTMLGGSDLDFRGDTDPENIGNFAQKVLTRTINELNIKPEKDIAISQNDFSTTWYLYVRDGIIPVGRRNMTEIYPYSYPLIAITYGRYPNSGIPFCDYSLMGREQSKPGVPTEEDRILFSMSYAPQRHRLTEAMKTIDTRTGPAINTWDSDKTSNYTSYTTDLRQLPKPMFFDLAHNYDLTTSILPSGLIASRLNGVMVNNKLTFERRKQPPDAEGFILVKPEAVQILSDKIRFGYDFGTMSTTDSLLEVMRVLRKSLLYGALDWRHPMTQRAIHYMHDNEERIQLTLAGSLQTRKEAKREAEVALYYDPKGFIQSGNLFNLQAMFPRWHYLNTILPLLPYQEPPQQGDLIQLASKKQQDGWHAIARAVRERFKKIIPEIKKKNDVELIFWLLATQETSSAQLSPTA